MNTLKIEHCAPTQHHFQAVDATPATSNSPFYLLFCTNCGEVRNLQK